MRVIIPIAIVVALVDVASAAPFCEELDDLDPDPALPGTQHLRTYLRIDNAAAGDTRASYDRIAGRWFVDLKGYVFTPPEPLGAPTLIFLHGGGSAAKPPCAIVEKFLAEGFVVFAPLRRGEFPSTGVPLDTWTTINGGSALDYMRIQADDVPSAVAWARSLPLAGPVALMGHSNGGLLALLANRRPDGPAQTAPGHRCVIDISAGGANWGDKPLKVEALKDAVQRAIQPVFLLHGEDEPFHPNPTLTLSWIAAGVGRLGGFGWYPGSHVSIVKNPDRVAGWAPDVLDFLDDCLE